MWGDRGSVNYEVYMENVFLGAPVRSKDVDTRGVWTCSEVMGRNPDEGTPSSSRHFLEGEASA